MRSQILHWNLKGARFKNFKGARFIKKEPDFRVMFWNWQPIFCVHLSAGSQTLKKKCRSEIYEKSSSQIFILNIKTGSLFLINSLFHIPCVTGRLSGPSLAYAHSGHSGVYSIKINLCSLVFHLVRRKEEPNFLTK